MSEFHIIMGAKGGIGKTLLTLSLLLSKYQNGRNGIAVLDLNYINNDTSHVLQKVKGLKKGAPRGDFECYQKGNFILVTVKEKYKIMDIDTFFQVLMDIMDIPTVNNVVNPSTIIIDTSYWINNFSYVSNDILERFARFIQNNHAILHIWLSWTVNSLNISNKFAQQDVEIIKGAIRKLSCYLINDPYMTPEEKIGHWSSLYLKHVFNAYSIFVHKKRIVEMFDNNYHHPQLKQLYDLPRAVGGIAINELFDDVLKQINKKIFMADEFMSELVEKIKQNSQNEESCPGNVFPIHTFYSKIAGYTDEISMQSDFESITNLKPYIEDFYNLLSRFL